MKTVKPTVTILDREYEPPRYRSVIFRFFDRLFPRLFDLVSHWYWYLADPHYRMVIDLDRIFRDKTDRIDLLPEPSGQRGFVLSIDRQTALYFVQDGDRFFYEGWSASGSDRYEKGSPLASDALRDFHERQEKEAKS